MTTTNFNINARLISEIIVTEFPTVTPHSIISQKNFQTWDTFSLENRDYGVTVEYRLCYGIPTLWNFVIPDELYPLVCLELFGTTTPSSEDKCIFKVENKIPLEDYTEVAAVIAYPKGCHSRAQCGWAKRGGESPIHYRNRFYKKYTHRRAAIKRGEVGEKARYGGYGHSSRW